jgi:hypothetical protein
MNHSCGREQELAPLLLAVVGAAASSCPNEPYPPPATVAELGQELGVDAGDIEVMIGALGERVDDELTAAQAADLLGVLDAKVRLRP